MVRYLLGLRKKSFGRQASPTTPLSPYKTVSKLYIYIVTMQHAIPIVSKEGADDTGT